MKNIVLILIFGINTVHAQLNTSPQVDSISQDSLLNRIENFEKLMLSSQKRSDSLNKELLYYKVKEDFYATALSDQANRFALIVSGVLALFAIITFGGFRYEVTRIQKASEKKFIKHKKLFKTQSKKLKSTKNKMLSTRGNLSITIAIILKKEKDFSGAFLYYLSGASDRITKDSKEDDNNLVLLSNLTSAKEMLDKISTKAQKESIHKNKDYIFRYLTKLSECKDEEVKSRSASIRVKYDELIHDIA